MPTPAHLNPFRPERFERLTFVLPEGVSWEGLLADAHRRGGQGRPPVAIVGGHGSGKTTLLDRLANRYAEAGRRCVRCFVQRSDRRPRLWRRVPSDWHHAFRDIQAGDVVLMDGYGHLSPLARREVLRATQAAGVRIVACHRRPMLPVPLPVLLRLRPTVALVAGLCEQLAPQSPPREELSKLFQAHRRNVREVWRTLYDRHAGGVGETTPRARPERRG